MRCPSCQFEVSEGVKFCIECGAQIKVKCAKCGTKNLPQAKFCGECGTPLGAAANPSVHAPPGGAPGFVEPLAVPAVAPPAMAATPEAERRQLTVMFCDLVGSTALSEELDPEELREVVRAYQEESADVIGRFDGHIAQYLGDGLLVYFGYPFAHEDDAQRAVRAGLGIVDGIEKLNARLKREKGVGLAVRIGIHTGPVVVGEMGSGERRERLAMGETPNVTARLQGLADPNAVIIGAETQRLVDGLFVFDGLGSQNLKGVSEPVSAFQVRGESTAESRFEATAMRGLTPLVGRAEEIATLMDRWEQAKGGGGQAVLLMGEAGVGKSRILHGIRERLKKETHNLILYYCSPYHRNSALYPAINQLERGLRFEKEDSPTEKLVKLEGVLSGLGLPLPEQVPVFASLLSLPMGERYPPLDLSPQQLRKKTLAALLAIFEAMAAQRPVLMVVEDAHWMDPSTDELISLFIERARRARLLLLISCRPEFAPAWSSRVGVTALRLDRLDRRDCASMVAKVTGGKDLPEEIFEQIVSRTDGVPLFVEELTKTVLESGLLKEEAGRYELTGPLPALAIPATLQDSLMARLDRLVPSRKEVVQVGAAIGRDFSYEMIESLAPVVEESLQDALEHLGEVDLIHQRGVPPEAVYAFKHGLVRDAAYQSLLKSKRRRLHRSFAEVLEARFPDIAKGEPEILAHHFTEAGLPGRAIGYWERSGKRAAERSANAEAIGQFTKALELTETLPESGERDELELGLRVALGGPLLMTKGHGAPEVERTFSRARELCRRVGKTAQLLPALFGLWRFYIIRPEFLTARDLGEQLLDLGQTEREAATLVMARYALGFTLFNLGEAEAAEGHFDEGAAVYDPELRRSLVFRLGQDPGVACLSYSTMVSWMRGHKKKADQKNHQALALAQDLSHPFSQAFAYCVSALFHGSRREGEPALNQAEAALQLSTEQGFSLWAALAAILRGWALSQQGKKEEGIGQLLEGLAGWRATGGELFQPYYHSLLAETYLNAGQDAVAVSVLDEGLALVQKNEERWSESELHRLKGEGLLRQGLPGAEACFRQALDVTRRQGVKSWELRAATSLARLWQSQGRIQEAMELLTGISGWFTEGHEDTDLVAAKRLIGEMS